MRHVKLEIDVGEVDIIDLKIKGGTQKCGVTLGTLHIEKTGLAFSPPKAKKEPEHRISWGKLPQLIALSNGFAELQEKK